MLKTSNRLWTLQESALAAKGRPIVQFRDDHRVVDDCVDHAVELLNERGCPVLAVATQRLQLHRAFTKYTPQCFPIDCVRLRETFENLAFRKTSVITDEAICLANLVGGDVVPILRACDGCGNSSDGGMDEEMKVEKRMVAFWSQTSIVPLEVAFMSGEKLSKPDFRWAPRTMTRGYRHLTGSARTDVVRHAEGLLISSWGLRIDVTTFTKFLDCVRRDHWSILEDSDWREYTQVLEESAGKGP